MEFVKGDLKEERMFVDTNILLFCMLGSDAAFHDRAERWSCNFHLLLAHRMDKLHMTGVQ